MTNETLLHFIETPIFTRRIEKLASTEVLFDLQNELLDNPKLGAVIEGTSGARKARIGERRQKRGKSGGFRYIYLHLEKVGIVYLMFIFAKNEQENLTGSQKKELAKIIREIKQKYGEK